MKKIAATFLLLSLSIQNAQAMWCGYNEFQGRIQEVTPKSAIWNQANICGSGGGPEQTITVTSLDGQKTCQVTRTVISNNLYTISEKICPKAGTDKTSAAICNGAFQALRVQDPASLKHNPAYEAIFGCKNASSTTAPNP
jgi:hypothetical protein